MKRLIHFGGMALILLSLSAGVTVTSCGTSKHCVGVHGTGNSSAQGRKVKIRKGRDTGVMSKKMARQMDKAERKKANKIEGKKLSFDQ